MPKIVAQGQLTITDLYDMPPLTARLGSNLPKSQTISNPTTYGGNDVYTPDWSSNNVIITAQLYESGNTSELLTNNSGRVNSIAWYYTLGSGAETNTLDDATTSGTGGSLKHNTVTINKNKMSRSNPILKIRAVISYTYPGMTVATPISTEIDFSASVQAPDIYSIVPSNENFSVAVDLTGNAASAQTQTCTFNAYKGATSIPAANISVGLPNATGFTFSVSSNVLTINIASGSGLSGSANTSGAFTVTLTIDGKTFTKDLTWTKSKVGATGATGASGEVYSLSASAGALVYDETTSSYQPTTITVSGYSKIGNGAQNPYSTWYKIETSTDGSTFTQAAVSTANGASLSYTLPSTKLKAVKVLMYTPNSATTLLDSQVVPVVSEAKKPVTVSVYTPKGDTFRNGTGSLEGKVEVYKNGSIVTPTTRSWHKGTDLVTSIGTSDTLTITPSMVPSMEVFTVKVVVDGTTYSETISIMDFTDPIMTDIQSSNGLIFKNATGTTVLRCALWRQGAEIDTAGTGYLYSWVKIKDDGNPDLAFVPNAVEADGAVLTGITVSSKDGTSKIITLNVAPHEGLKVGQRIKFSGANTTFYKITAIDIPGKTITVDTAVAAGVAAGNTLTLAKYKEITVVAADVTNKASYRCEVYAI